MNTPVSKVMKKNLIYVFSITLVVESLQNLVLDTENDEVIALLNIAKCLSYAIGRMENAAEKEKARAAAVEGVGKHWGTTLLGPNTIVAVSPFDTVVMVTKKMLEFRVSSAIVTVDNKARQIIISNDILTQVIAQDLPAESTSVEKVPTPFLFFITIFFLLRFCLFS
ncbi:unnamed protein product [Lactuca saligna]|uniref:Uncharacterized protein n=1 Tax=Lactuca saligna TaxID=75948 RepID=A0AA35V010_LACSI|nr:unnamed protein product [Lactuca saligna]